MPGWLTTLPHAEKHHSPQHHAAHYAAYLYGQLPAFCGPRPVKPASQYHRSYYDHTFFHQPPNVLCKKHGNCDTAARPLCLRGGISQCHHGHSSCYNGVHPHDIGHVGQWKDAFALNQYPI
jgi:hypothetical protein